MNLPCIKCFLWRGLVVPILYLLGLSALAALNLLWMWQVPIGHRGIILSAYCISFLEVLAFTVFGWIYTDLWADCGRDHPSRGGS